MPKSGMTRRIDELGRLVIPKEIRKNLKIKDNDQIEISIVNDKIVLSKYDLLNKDDIVHKIILCMKKTLEKNVLFTSREKIIDGILLNRENVNNALLNNEVTSIIEYRKEVIDSSKKITLYQNVSSSSWIISPLIVNGDLYGSLILYGDSVNEIDISILHFVKTFLEIYLE